MADPDLELRGQGPVCFAHSSDTATMSPPRSFIIFLWLRSIVLKVRSLTLAVFRVAFSSFHYGTNTSQSWLDTNTCAHLRPCHATRATRFCARGPVSPLRKSGSLKLTSYIKFRIIVTWLYCVLFLLLVFICLFICFQPSNSEVRRTYNALVRVVLCGRWNKIHQLKAAE